MVLEYETAGIRGAESNSVLDGERKCKNRPIPQLFERSHESKVILKFSGAGWSLKFHPDFTPDFSAGSIEFSLSKQSLCSPLHPNCRTDWRNQSIE